jgi:hypothetical protein
MLRAVLGDEHQVLIAENERGFGTCEMHADDRPSRRDGTDAIGDRDGIGASISHCG